MYSDIWVSGNNLFLGNQRVVLFELKVSQCSRQREVSWTVRKASGVQQGEREGGNRTIDTSKFYISARVDDTGTFGFGHRDQISGQFQNSDDELSLDGL